MDHVYAGCRSRTAFAVEAFTKPGDKIAIQTPVYPPFYNVVRENGRKLVTNPLTVTEDGGYEMDFEDLERSGK